MDNYIGTQLSAFAAAPDATMTTTAPSLKRAADSAPELEPARRKRLPGWYESRARVALLSGMGQIQGAEIDTHIAQEGAMLAKAANEAATAAAEAKDIKAKAKAAAKEERAAAAAKARAEKVQQRADAAKAKAAKKLEDQRLARERKAANKTSATSKATSRRSSKSNSVSTATEETASSGESSARPSSPDAPAQAGETPFSLPLSPSPEESAQVGAEDVAPALNQEPTPFDEAYAAELEADIFGDDDFSLQLSASAGTADVATAALNQESALFDEEAYAAGLEADIFGDDDVESEQIGLPLSTQAGDKNVAARHLPAAEQYAKYELEVLEEFEVVYEDDSSSGDDCEYELEEVVAVEDQVVLKAPVEVAVRQTEAYDSESEDSEEEGFSGREALLKRGHGRCF